MFSPKTKNSRLKRLFLIVFTPIVGSALALSAHSLIAASHDPSLVKDQTVLAPDVSQEQSGSSVEPLTPVGDKPVITTYVVKHGDTLSSIASDFSISTNTLLWANDLNKKSVLKEGQKLTILPVSGIIYTVGKGDTLGGIALKFDANTDEIVSFNDLEDNKVIKVGMKLVIPNAEMPVVTEKAEPKPAPKIVVSSPAPTEEPKDISVTPQSVAPVSVATDTDSEGKTVIETEPISKGYFTHPIPGSVLTQGAHGYNGVDFGAPVGTTVLAAADGKVIVAHSSGYGGGYGHYVVIEHDNGTQTLYAHLSTVLVSVDDQVSQGDKIALSGNTGHSTGPHMHFEVRGGTNPWVGIKKGTEF